MFIIVSLSKHSYNVCVFLTMFLVLLFLHFRTKSNDVFKKFKKRSLTFSSIESYLQVLLSVKIKKNVSLLNMLMAPCIVALIGRLLGLLFCVYQKRCFIVKTLFRWFLSYPNMRVSYAVVSISIPSYRLSCTREG